MRYEIETKALYIKPKLNYLGLIGHQNAGKDFVANYLTQNLDRKCEVVKFATKLTEVVAAILGVTNLSLFQDREWKEKKQFWWQGNLASSRDVQISVGTDICRNLLGDNVWVDAFANQHNDPDTLYIISDLRFENEVKFIQANSGITVYIENQKASLIQYQKELVDGIHTLHSSEELVWAMYNGYFASDYTLKNNDYSDPQPLQNLVTFIKSI